MKEKSCCIEVHSWLGNQMFIYAYVRALSLRNKTNFKLDISYYKTYFRPYQLDIFNIKKNYANNKDIPFYKNRKPSIFKWGLVRIDPLFHWEWYMKKNPLKFDPKFLNIKRWYITWHFMSEKYFIDQREYIKNDFEFIKPISEKTKEVEKIVSNKHNTVSIHIRRWDFLKYPDCYPQIDYSYYEKAINIIKNRIDNPLFVICSDDLEYVYKNFGNLDNKIIIDFNRWENSWQDMYLMSKCKHNITAYSSFSWWWAYLNNNKNKIILCPEKRFVPQSHFYDNDIVPDNWIKI